MRKAIAWKGFGYLLVINLVCLLLAGCGTEGQGSLSGSPAAGGSGGGEGQGSLSGSPAAGGSGDNGEVQGSLSGSPAAGGSGDNGEVQGSLSGSPAAGGSGDNGEGQGSLSGSPAAGSGGITENPAYNANGRQVLTVVVAAPFVSGETLERIKAFNKNNSSYFAELKSYKPEGALVLEAEDLETQLTLEILSGKGPDLVIWDGLYTPTLASEKLMEDLNGFMDADPDFHREDYFENILQALERNGGLYVLPASFTVTTMCGKAEELGTGRGVTESWEFGEILEVFENSPHAEMVFEYPNKEYMLRHVGGGCMGNFVDWSSGECHFDTPAFVELLEFCNTLPDGFDHLPDSYAEAFSSGKILVNMVGLSSPWKMADVRAYFGDADLLWPGIPVADGEKDLGGGMAGGYHGESFSICRNSSNKEGAWEFVKSFLAEDMQREMEGNPLLRSAFEEKIQDALTVEYETVNGTEREKIRYEVLLTEVEGSVGFSCITEEDAEMYRTMIENTHRSSGSNAGIMDIILEEAAAYFGGDKDAAAAAEIIQSRVSVYVSERMN